MTDAPTGVCLLPRVLGLGGPASFQRRLIHGLNARGIAIHHDPLAEGTRAILINGGSHQIIGLLRAKNKGVRMVQRLNGMNWLHRQQNTGLRHWLKSEWNNFILSFIRRYLADAIVYQSEFSRQWWQRIYGVTPDKSTCVVHNGVDLDIYTPHGEPYGEPSRPVEHYRLLMLEGHLRGGHELGLKNGVALAEALSGMCDRPLELMVVGDVPAMLCQQISVASSAWITWHGVVREASCKGKADEVPAIHRSAHLLYSADLNAACPNSVIEALACGLPVISFDTGALAELVPSSCGAVIPYGSNVWNLEPPDIASLASAALPILQGQGSYRVAARKHAEAHFGIDKMLDGYVDVLFG
jgi:glycosyltransferase involved in cell wall biosynthesis